MIDKIQAKYRVLLVQNTEFFWLMMNSYDSEWRDAGASAVLRKADIWENIGYLAGKIVKSLQSS